MAERTNGVGGRIGRLLLRLLYWVIVLAISALVVTLLIQFFEARDSSQIDSRRPPVVALA